MVSEILKEDLKLVSGFDLVKFGLQIAAIKDQHNLSDDLKAK